MDHPAGEITQLLAEVHHGDKNAESRLIALVYHELHRMAQRYLRMERGGHTLQPTALVNEAYIRLLSGAAPSFENRAQFFAVCAQVMRHILVDYARSQRAAKRGGEAEKITLDDAFVFSEDRSEEVLVLDQALTRLAQFDERQCRIVELKFFGGMTEDEISQLLGVSARTVKRDWSIARAWLYGELHG